MSALDSKCPAWIQYTEVSTIIMQYMMSNLTWVGEITNFVFSFIGWQFVTLVQPSITRIEVVKCFRTFGNSAVIEQR